MNNVIGKISVAPMMDVTDRHFRMFLRFLSKRTALYTEMITAGSLLHNPPEKFLAHDDREHPLAAQLAGNDPSELAECAKICGRFGFDEINLNVGCPSKNARAGNFGAVLMKQPERVAECVAAIIAATEVPVSLKIRLGVDDDGIEDFLRFIDVNRKAGCVRFIVHARKAVLGGISPKQNRSLPAIDYETAWEAKKTFGDCSFILNGEIKSVEQGMRWLERFDGVMLGRSVRDNPALLCQADAKIYGLVAARFDEAFSKYVLYARQAVERGVRPGKLAKGLENLFKGKPGAKRWRILMADTDSKPERFIDSLERASELFREAV